MSVPPIHGFVGPAGPPGTAPAGAAYRVVATGAAAGTAALVQLLKGHLPATTVFTDANVTAGPLTFKPAGGTGATKVLSVLNALDLETFFVNDGGSVTASQFNGIFAGNGKSLTSLNASNVSQGTLADARLSANVPRKDANNQFTAPQEVRLASGQAFAVKNADGSATFLNIDADGFLTGTAANYSGNVTANTFYGSAAGLTDLPGGFSGSAAEITADTLDDARLSANVAKYAGTTPFTALQTFNAGISTIKTRWATVDLSGTPISGTTNNYTLGGLGATGTLFRVAGTSTPILTGISIGQTVGDVIALYNAGAEPIPLTDNSGSTATNRFQFTSGEAYYLLVGKVVFLIYEGSGAARRWRPLHPDNLVPPRVVQKPTASYALDLFRITNENFSADYLKVSASGVLTANGGGLTNVPAAAVTGVLSPANMPAVALSEYKGAVASQAAMTALAAERGDWCVRTDQGKTYILSTDTPSNAADWIEVVTPGGAVAIGSAVTGSTAGRALVVGSGGVLADAGSAAFTGATDIAWGGITILAGAEFNSSNRTNNANKQMRVAVPHYANAEEPSAVLVAYCDSVTSAALFGGGSGVMNAVTDLQFYTAANTTTTDGTLRLHVKRDGQTRFVPLGSTPGGLEDGDVWYDDALDKFRGRANGATVDLSHAAFAVNRRRDASALAQLLAGLATQGLVTDTSSDGITVVADGSTVTFDLDVSRAFEVTLGGNRTLALSNSASGKSFTLLIIQDGTGNRTVTWWSNIDWDGGATPTLSTAAGKIDAFTFVPRGSRFLGVKSGAFG